MSVMDRCSFCQRLPVIRGRSRRAEAVTRCPLCKCPLIRTTDQTYRCEELSDSPAKLAGRRARVAVVCGSVAAVVSIGGVFLHHTETVPASTGIPGQSALRIPILPLPMSDRIQPPEIEGIFSLDLSSAIPPPSVDAALPPPPGSLPQRPLLMSALTMQERPSQRQVAAETRRRAATRLENGFYKDDEIAAMLRQVPEISLVRPPKGPPEEDLPAEERMKLRRQSLARASNAPKPTDPNAKVALKPGEAEWNELRQTVQKDKERFLDGVVAKRPEFAGLPYRKGTECQMGKEAAEGLHHSADSTRRLLFGAPAIPSTGRGGGESNEAAHKVSTGLLHGLASNPRLARDYVRALDQLIPLELAPGRLGVVQYLEFDSNLPVAAAFLARRALFDSSPDVRQAAAYRLLSQNPKDYVPVLLEGLRYPWEPVNYHAANAFVFAWAKSTVRDLIPLLDAPDPCEPYEFNMKGKPELAVRELVRLNHNGSCLLCHAPSFAKDDPIRGPVPSPLAPIQPVYYDVRDAEALFVRADISYLRQDFSEVQSVESSGLWPKLQRYDFLIRQRKLTEAEAQVWRNREAAAGPKLLPASKRAIIYALQKLTGLEGGFTSRSWKEALARVVVKAN